MFAFDLDSAACVQEIARQEGVQNLTELLYKLNPNATIRVHNMNDVVYEMRKHPRDAVYTIEGHLNALLKLSFDFKYIALYSWDGESSRPIPIWVPLFCKLFPGLQIVSAIRNVPTEWYNPTHPRPILTRYRKDEPFRAGVTGEELRFLVTSGQYITRSWQWRDRVEAMFVDIKQFRVHLKRDEVIEELVKWEGV